MYGQNGKDRQIFVHSLMNRPAQPNLRFTDFQTAPNTPKHREKYDEELKRVVAEPLEIAQVRICVFMNVCGSC